MIHPRPLAGSLVLFRRPTRSEKIRSTGNPFYEALNGLFEANGFDEFAEELCGEFYAETRGRPGVAPGVYFRMLMVGYLEGIDSDRGIAWRCADSISLRGFLSSWLLTRPHCHSRAILHRTRFSFSAESRAANPRRSRRTLISMPTARLRAISATGS